MPWTIPDKGEGQNDIQSILFQEYLDGLVAGVCGTAIVTSGCGVTAQGAPDMTVAVASGGVISNGVAYVVTGANATITTANGTNPRFDLVVITSAGAIAVRAGTAAAAPKPPARAADDVLLAVVYVPAADTTISTSQITDLRILTAPATGTGNLVRATSPALVTPSLDVATGTSVVLTSTATASALIPSGASVPANGVYLPAANSVGISTNSVARVRVNSTGDVILNDTGSALSSSATGGFTDIPTCSGTPTGVPATVPTGTAPFVYDTNGLRLYVYASAAWKGQASLASNTFTGPQTANSFIPSSSTVPSNGVYLPAANAVGISTNSTARVRIDSAANGIFSVFGANTTTANGTGQIYAYSTNTAGADLGGQIVLGGSFTGTTETTFAAIAGRKSNATAGNIAGYMVLATNDATLGMVERMRIDASGHTTPGADNTQNFGSGALRWKEIFAGTAIINTSDAREKTVVTPLTKTEVEAAKQLAHEIGSYKWLTAVKAKGDSGARRHIGLTVQRAIEIMVDHKLDPMRYGFICYDEWPGGSRYSFRHDELLLFIARGFDARLAALEGKSNVV